MDELTIDLEKLKLSVCKKLQLIENDNIHEITIGPNRTTETSTTDRVKEESPKSPTSQGNDVICNKNRVPVRQLLKEFTAKSHGNAVTAIKARIKKFYEFSKTQEDIRKDRLHLMQKHFVLDLEAQEAEILETVSKCEPTFSSQRAKLVEQYHQDISAQHKLQEQQLKEKEKADQLGINLEKIRMFQLDFHKEYQTINNLILKANITSEQMKKLAIFQEIKTLSEYFESIIKQCKTLSIDEQHVKQAQEIVANMQILSNYIETALLKPKEVDKPKPVTPPPLPTPPPQQEPQVEIEAIEVPEALPEPEPEPVRQEIVEVPQQVDLSKYVSVANFESCTKILEFLDNHTQSFSDLLNDSSAKQFRFDCKKAINIPVNTISAISTEHLLDKYTRLHKLLAGQTIIVAEKQINASRHPQGIAFCMDLLARKFVLQGDLMISSNPDAAFCYATIILSLWNDFEVFGKLLLGYFYKSCPYLVPYDLPQTADESDEEYYTRQGYQFKDGQIEKQDKFLKRMTGICRLFASLMITKPKKSQTTSPLTLRDGWKWLVSLMKLEPRVDITACILHTLLDTIGFAMDETYGRIFKKLVRIIAEQILPLAKKECTGGSGIRLELLLGEYIKNGAFAKPAGFTPYSNW